jgi:hypothetical protein
MSERKAKLNPDWVVSVPYGTSGHVCGFVFSDAEAGMKAMREVANLFNSIQRALTKPYELGSDDITTVS